MRKGITLIELIVSVVLMLVLLASVYSFYIMFVNNSSRERIKAQTLKEVREAFRILEDDVRHAGFGYPKSGCFNKGVCLFYVDDSCNVDEQFCKQGSDRFFVADGWTIIEDFTKDHYPDGEIPNAVYETIVSQKFFAKVETYAEGAKDIVVDKIDIDNSGSEDIKSKKAIIVCGRRDNANKVIQEGRRIEKVKKGAFTFDLIFNSKEKPLEGIKDCSTSDKGKVLPAIVWYVRKATDGRYWLYRNEEKVLPNVEDFKVFVGYDFNGDGIVDTIEENATEIPKDASSESLRFFKFHITVAYYWKNKKYLLDYDMKVDAFH